MTSDTTSKGLSKRERFLIFFAAVVLVVFVSVQFAVIPMYTRYSELTEEYDLLVMERMRVETKIATEPAIIAYYERAQERFYAINEKYPVNIPNEEIVSIITEICQRSGFESLLSLSVSPQRRALGEEISAFGAASIAMSLGGGFDSVRRLIAAVSEIDYIRLSSISFAGPQAAESGGASSSNISVAFEMTVMNEIVRESLEENGE
jgi:hypothetical protein